MMKIERFKKGQIVPRRLGLLLATVKGAQHHVVFGMDATWDGTNLDPAHRMSFYDVLIRVSSGMYAPRKNGTRQKSGLILGRRFTMESSYDSRTGERSARITRKDPSMERTP